MTLFETVEQMIHDGKNLSQFVKDLLDYERDLMMVASAKGVEKILKTSADVKVLERQANALGLERILRDLGYLIELDHQLKWSTNTRIQMEMTLVKLSQNESKVVYTERPVASSMPVKSTSTAERPVAQVPKASPPKVVEESSPVLEGVEAIAGDADPKVIEAKWNEVIQYLAKNKKASVKALLVEGVLIGTMGKIVQVGYPELYGFHLNAIQKDENRVEVEKAIHAVTGYSVRAQFDFLDAFQSKKSKSDEGADALEDLKGKLGEFATYLEVIE